MARKDSFTITNKYLIFKSVLYWQWL